MRLSLYCSSNEGKGVLSLFGVDDILELWHNGSVAVIEVSNNLRMVKEGPAGATPSLRYVANFSEGVFHATIVLPPPLMPIVGDLSLELNHLRELLNAVTDFNSGDTVLDAFLSFCLLLYGFEDRVRINASVAEKEDDVVEVNAEWLSGEWMGKPPQRMRRG